MNDWGIIRLNTTNISNDESDDVSFKTILKEVETRMSETILIYMYRGMRKDNKDTDKYYIIQQRSEPYILSEDNNMQEFELPIKAYAGEIVCDDVFFNSTPNATYRYTSMIKLKNMKT